MSIKLQEGFPYFYREVEPTLSLLRKRDFPNNLRSTKRGNYIIAILRNRNPNQSRKIEIGIKIDLHSNSWSRWACGLNPMDQFDLWLNELVQLTWALSVLHLIC